MNRSSCFICLEEVSNEDVNEAHLFEKQNDVFFGEDGSSAVSVSGFDFEPYLTTEAEMSERGSKSDSCLIELNKSEDTTFQMSDNSAIDPDTWDGYDEKQVRSVSVTELLEEGQEIEFASKTEEEFEEKWKVYLGRIGDPKCPICEFEDSEWGPVEEHVLNYHGAMQKFDRKVFVWFKL